MNHPRTLHVLLVEDDPADARLMLALLGGPGVFEFETSHRTSMAAALTHLAENTVDIVLLDLGLPDARGLDAVRQAHALAPRVPLVVLTGWDDDEVSAAALREGAQDYLIKGQFELQALLRALRYAIERKLAEEALFLEKERAQVTLNAISDAVLSTDHQGRIASFNLAAEKMTGQLAQTVLMRKIEEVIKLTDLAEHDIATDLAAGAAPLTPAGQALPGLLLNRATGEKIPVEYGIAAIRGRDGSLAGAVLNIRDMSQTRAIALEMTHRAQHDSLTGLPNRLLLSDRIAQAIAVAPRRQVKLGLLFLDLDGFKHINDTLGHAAGDKLLQSVAERIVSCVRASDTVCRLGGDEFVALLSEIAAPEDAAIAAGRIIESISQPHIIDQQAIEVTCSIGISLWPDDGLDVKTLMTNADMAMYRAKEQGRRGYRFFEPNMNARAEERRFINDGLRRALDRDGLALHYQPIVDIRTGRITSAEALVRWTHPRRGMISPAQFIPVAEDCGLIIPLGQWVLKEACRQAKEWANAGLPPITMAVNVSALEFSHKGFLENLLETLSVTGMDPGGLELELTETALMKSTAATAKLLERLRELGLRLAIDDFGTGYSSLSYLTKFPVDTMKIDQSFIRQVSGNPPDVTLVTAMIGIARNLKLRVVAEGVETEAELRVLQREDGQEAQGFYFSHPVPARNFTAILRNGACLTKVKRQIA